MSDVPLTIVGAGVVGLAVAARLAKRFPDLVVLERHERPGLDTSSRNSEVIHAGLYYPTDSWKARLCVAGRDQLYELCVRHDLPHRRLGKLVVATAPEELPQLERLLAQGRANGVELEWLSAAEARDREPHVPSLAALWSPSSGVLNAHALMDLFAHQARSAGATLQPRTELVTAERRDRDYRLVLATPDGREELTSERVVNAAGLESDRVAALPGLDLDAAGYRLHFCKGSYFALPPARWGLVSRLVYPVPGHASLGTHGVLDVAGRLRFGPDVEYLPHGTYDYAVDERRRPAFAASVRRLLPMIADHELTPDIAGIRPKLQGPGEPFRDFAIAEERERGLPGWVNLVGIDSPGLTASPAIAAEVERLLSD